MNLSSLRILVVVVAALGAACGAGPDVESTEVESAGVSDEPVGEPVDGPVSTEPTDGVPCDDSTAPAGCDLPTPEELRAMNLHYADRLPFAGDPEEAEVVVAEVRGALESLVASDPEPSPEAVADALRSVVPGEEPQVSTNAVRTGGTGFGVWAAGGCVHGSVNGGAVEVAVSGPINDGGCLASYGH